VDPGTAWIILLRGIGGAFLLWLISPVSWAVRKWVPDGRIKRLLLIEVGDKKTPGAGR
jgi:hypothetical protein